MATKKISELATVPGPLASTDYFVLVQSGVTYKIEFSGLLSDLWGNRPVPTEYVGPLAGTEKIVLDGDEYVSYSDIKSDILSAVPAPPDTLDELTDVTIITPSPGELLRFDGADWVNDALALDDLSDVSATTPTTGDVLVFNGTVWEAAEPTKQITVSATAPVSPATNGLWLDIS